MMSFESQYATFY